MALPTMKDGRVTRLAIIRVARGVDYYWLARAIEVHADDIVQWEYGETIPPMVKLRRIALALGWPIEAVLGDPIEEESAVATLARARRDLVECGWPGPPEEEWAVGLIR